METFLYVLAAIFSFLLLILIHEAGHYCIGKLLKFKITEFSVGFGPAILKKKKKNGELFSLRLFPLGGYCAFAGEGEDSVESEAFENQKPWKRIIVLLSGAFFNYFSAILLLVLFFSCYGNYMPEVTKTFSFEKGEQSFEVGDVILEIEGQPLFFNIDNDIGALMAKYGDSVKVGVLRQGEKKTITAYRERYFTEEGEKVGYGISFAEEKDGAYYTKIYRHKYGFFEAMSNSFVFSGKLISKTFEVLGGVLSGNEGVKGNIGGPITAISSMTDLSRTGFDGLLYGICVLSVSLAIMNLLPIPALDGLKALFTAIEWVRKKPIDKKIEAAIHMGIFAVIAFVIVLDLINIFG